MTTATGKGFSATSASGWNEDSWIRCSMGSSTACGRLGAWAGPAAPFVGLTTLIDRYLVRMGVRSLLGPPHLLCGWPWACLPADPYLWAQRFYHGIAPCAGCPAPPPCSTGTCHHQLSSCYLADVHDSMDHILESARDFGSANARQDQRRVSKLRAVGSPVRGVNGQSSASFLHPYFDRLIKAVNQGGAGGAWRLHRAVAPGDPRFLDLRENSGDPYLRAHSLNTALWIPDGFSGGWSGMVSVRPQYAGLTEVFGEEFRQRITPHPGPEEGRIPARAWQVCDAGTTGTSWPCRRRTVGHLQRTRQRATCCRRHSLVNLCTEIFLPTSPDEVAVCNWLSQPGPPPGARVGLGGLSHRSRGHAGPGPSST